MSSLKPISTSNGPGNEKILILTSLLVILAISVLWYMTEGFTDGSLEPLTIPVLAASMIVSAVLGILDAYSVIEKRLQQLHGNNIFIRLIIGVLIGLGSAALALNVSTVLVLVITISFLLGESVGRAYYVFAK
ncbi:hypothetical protein [Natrinema pallidum]|uniref:hypothetical protein n=1 Tax=Natrinema pallidum TaxID=69527 RepID=UPI0012692B8D|nr:hypothetical protein [Natrinema pallidum]